MKNVCFIILKAQDVVSLKASMSNGRNIFKNILKLLKYLQNLYQISYFFLLLVLATEW